MRAIAERFWEKVARGELGACWMWLAATGASGYGTFGVGNGQMRPAHRVAWEITNGPIPDGLHVCHRCDNPPCCNPGHLFLGTRSDNMRDMVAKGRHGSQRHPALHRGERNGRAVLTDEQVREIRRRYGAGESQPRLAATFLVSKSLIDAIVRREAWAHLPPTPDEIPRGRPRGESHYGARLTGAMVSQARHRVAAGETLSDVARSLGVKRATLGYAVSGHTWRHVLPCGLAGGAQ